MMCRVVKLAPPHLRSTSSLPLDDDEWLPAAVDKRKRREEERLRKEQVREEEQQGLRKEE